MAHTAAKHSTVTDSRNVVARLLAFVVERYPPIPQVVLVAFLWAAGVTMSVVIWAPAAGATPGTADIAKLALGFLGALCFVFHMRVFDDVKDADTDRIIEPTRPIPRGLVSEREVDMLSIVLLALEAALFAGIGSLALAVWAIAAGFTVLMRVEFFVGEWLERHVLTYAISHMASMALVYASLIAAGIDTFGMQQGVTVGDVISTPALAIACLASVALGLGFELGRKFERYAEAHGIVAWILLAACPTLGVAMFAVAARADYPTWVPVTLAVTAAISLVAHAALIARAPRPTNEPSHIGKNMREAIEAVPGVVGLVTYLVLAVAGLIAVNW